MAASFSALWGAPHVICDDRATLIDGLWMYDKSPGLRLSCGLYRLRSGELALRVWRNSQFYREWRSDEATLRAEADANRQALEQLGWEAV